MEQVITRAKKVLVSPADALLEVKSEAIGVTQLMKEYVVVIAAVPAAAMFVAMLGHASFFRSVFYCALVYAIGLLSVFVFGKIIDALAPHFGSSQNADSAFKLAAYAFTPSFIAGIFNINPSLAFLGTIGSLYGIYIFYLGLPVMMETPADKRITYTAVSLIVMIVVMIVLTLIASTIVWGGMGGVYGY